jgi:hypothetical protein
VSGVRLAAQGAGAQRQLLVQARLEAITTSLAVLPACAIHQDTVGTGPETATSSTLHEPPSTPVCCP